MGTLLQSYTGTKVPHTECRVERLCKCSVDSVQKLHAIRHTVKCKCSCCIIQVDANTRWHWSWNICALIVVYKGKFRVRAVQTPGLVVPAQAAFIAFSFPADSPVGNSNVYLCSPPVHLPVTASPSHALLAQHLEWNGRNDRIKRQNAFLWMAFNSCLHKGLDNFCWKITYCCTTESTCHKDKGKYLY